MTALYVLLIAVVLVIVLFGVPPIRRTLLSNPIFKVFKRVMPPMSQTEADAINAGTVWWDGELFSGRPDWAKLISYPKPTLSAEEQRFLDNETDELCRLCDDWDTYAISDLSPQAWQYIKDHRFFGMIIPKEYGGKGFSAYMHSQVITKLSTRCSAAAVTVMVPNSLGPAELLLQYGTEEQKRYYLPRLASGEETGYGLGWKLPASRSPVRTPVRTPPRFPISASSAKACGTARKCWACA